MNRRAFIGGLALGTLEVPRVAPAQPARKVPRIGILGNSATSGMVGPQPQAQDINALLRGLRDLGYVYGEHFVTEPRGTEGKPERFLSLAAELVRLQVRAGPPAGTYLRVRISGNFGGAMRVVGGVLAGRAAGTDGCVQVHVVGRRQP